MICSFRALSNKAFNHLHNAKHTGVVVQTVLWGGLAQPAAHTTKIASFSAGKLWSGSTRDPHAAREAGRHTENGCWVACWGHGHQWHELKATCSCTRSAESLLQCIPWNIFIERGMQSSVPGILPFGAFVIIFYLCLTLNMSCFLTAFKTIGKRCLFSQLVVCKTWLEKDKDVLSSLSFRNNSCTESTLAKSLSYFILATDRIRMTFHALQALHFLFSWYWFSLHLP